MAKKNKKIEDSKLTTKVVINAITDAKKIASALKKDTSLKQNEPSDTEKLLISINRTLVHSDRLAGWNILMFTFLSTEIILLTIGDALNYLTKGITILPFQLNFPVVSLVISVVFSVAVSAFIWYLSKPN